MIITFSCGDDMFSTEASPETEMEPLLVSAMMEMESIRDLRYDQFGMVYDGKQLLAVTVLKKTIQEMQLKDGDVIHIIVAKRPLPPVSSTSGVATTSTDSGRLQGVLPDDKVKRLSNIISSIKVPTTKPTPPRQQAPDSSNSISYKKFRAVMLDVYHKLESSPFHRDVLHGDSPDLFACWDANKGNFETFFDAVLKYRDELERQENLAMSDPTSVDGQKYIAELIRKQNIKINENYAIENLPEAAVSVSMLYIPLKINGQEVIGFVDTGAQVSIMSEECAKRCNVDRLLDRRYKMTAVGIGGTQKFVGRLHSCEVQVQDHQFDCQFNVASDRSLDLLIGLDVMKRHSCCVDLEKNVLRFKDGTEAPFLHESAVNEYNELHVTGFVEVDPESLAQMVAMGYDSRVATAELLKTYNNVEAAVKNLSEKKDEPMEE